MGLFYFVFQLSLGFLPSPWLSIYILCVLLNITSHVLSSFTLQFFTTFWSLEVQKLKYLSRFKPLTNTMVHNHSNANKRTDFEHFYLLLFIYLFIFRFLLDVTNSHFFGYLFMFTHKKKTTNKQTKTVQKYTSSRFEPPTPRWHPFWF
jgi:hypothetical protein